MTSFPKVCVRVGVGVCVCVCVQDQSITADDAVCVDMIQKDGLVPEGMCVCMCVCVCVCGYMHTHNKHI